MAKLFAVLISSPRLFQCRLPLNFSEFVFALNICTKFTKSIEFVPAFCDLQVEARRKVETIFSEFFGVYSSRELLGNATEVDNECRLCPNFKESQTTSFTTPTTDTDGRCTQEWPPMPGTGSAIKEGRKFPGNSISVLLLEESAPGRKTPYFTPAILLQPLEFIVYLTMFKFGKNPEKCKIITVFYKNQWEKCPEFIICNVLFI